MTRELFFGVPWNANLLSFLKICKISRKGTGALGPQRGQRSETAMATACYLRVTQENRVSRRLQRRAVCGRTWCHEHGGLTLRVGCLLQTRQEVPRIETQGPAWWLTGTEPSLGKWKKLLFMWVGWRHPPHPRGGGWVFGGHSLRSRKNSKEPTLPTFCVSPPLLLLQPVSLLALDEVPS